MRIVSGGQTGVDRAALEVASELGLEPGGWCPLGRRAEDGRIPERFPLKETPSARYEERTEWNVRDSDATLIVAAGPLSGGTALTARIAKRLGRPVHVVDLDGSPDAHAVRTWLAQIGVETLNVAGPRESGVPGIQERAFTFLRTVLGPPDPGGTG